MCLDAADFQLPQMDKQTDGHVHSALYFYLPDKVGSAQVLLIHKTVHFA